MWLILSLLLLLLFLLLLFGHGTTEEILLLFLNKLMCGIKSKRSKRMFVLVSCVLSLILVRFIMSFLLWLVLLLFGYGTNTTEDNIQWSLTTLWVVLSPRNYSKCLLFSLVKLLI